MESQGHRRFLAQSLLLATHRSDRGLRCRRNHRQRKEGLDITQTSRFGRTTRFNSNTTHCQDAGSTCCKTLMAVTMSNTPAGYGMLFPVITRYSNLGLRSLVCSDALFRDI